MPDPKPTPEQLQARAQAIAGAASAAMELLTNHGAMAGVGVMIVLATGKEPMILNSIDHRYTDDLLASAARQIREHNSPVKLVDPGLIDARKIRGENGNGLHRP